MSEGVNMTKHAIDRIDVLTKISQHRLSKAAAAKTLGVSYRHLLRLYSDFQNHGASAFISKQRGKPSNHQLDPMLRARIRELITIPDYEGFGPKFMCEKLYERHGIEVSVEALRKLMILEEVWRSRAQKSPVVHQQRQRRSRCGELLQGDGSWHHWFEDREDPCSLVLFIDDATGRVYGKFFEYESTQAYMVVLQEYLIKFGRPLALYVDKHSTFRINKPGCLKKDLVTQFGRACKEIDILLICANTSQAKGRIERVFNTLQDRLVKELRLAGISNMEEANRFLLMGYWDKFNSQFAKPSANQKDAHRGLLPEHNLKNIFSFKSFRTVSKNHEIQFENVVFQLKLDKPKRSLARSKVLVIKRLDGSIVIEHNGEAIPFVEFYTQEAVGQVVGSKEIDRFINKKVHEQADCKHETTFGKPYTSRPSML